VYNSVYIMLSSYCIGDHCYASCIIIQTKFYFNDNDDDHDDNNHDDDNENNNNNDSAFK